MHPSTHVAILKHLEKTKPELNSETTYPIAEVVQFDVNGTVQTGKVTTSTPAFRPPVIEALAVLIADMQPDDQMDVLDEFESGMRKLIRKGDKVKEEYAPQISLVKARVDKVQELFRSRTEPSTRRGPTTVAVEVKEV
jgi:hypothetical protein